MTHQLIWASGRVPLAVTRGTRRVVAIHDPGSPPGERERWLESAQRAWGAWAYAQRGHAPSGWVAGGVYRASDLAIDLIRLLRDLAGEPCVLAGQGAGGLIAVLAAAAAPDLVAGLHLLAGDSAAGWGADPARMVSENGAANHAWLTAAWSTPTAASDNSDDDPMLMWGPAEKLYRPALAAAAAQVSVPWWAQNGHFLQPYLPASMRAATPLLTPAELPAPAGPLRRRP